MSRFTRIVAVACVGVTLLLSATSAFAATSTKLATISSTVYGSDGLPIPEATAGLSVLRSGDYQPVATLTADAEGTVVAIVKPGSYKLDYAAPGAAPASTYLVAQKGSVYAFDVELLTFGAMSGTVRDLATGSPIENAVVQLYLRNVDSTWPSTPTVTLSAPSGTYATGQIATGEYHVSASAPGHANGFHDSTGLGTPSTVTVSRAATATDIDVSLAAVAQTGFITGRVMNGQYPLSSAYVFLYRQRADGTWPATSPGWGSPTVTVLTAPDGTYTSGELPLGNYKVRFFSTHYSSQWWANVLTADLATVLTLDTPGETIANIDGWYNAP